MGDGTIELWVQRANAGEPGAQDALFTAAYGELRRLARSRLRHGGRNTVLDTTALVHESYLRVMRGGALRGEGRRAFFAYASCVMRSVIVDTVRERRAQRRGGGQANETLDTGVADRAPAGAADDDLLRVHEALQALAAAEPRLARVVEMRYFGGFGEAEVGEALGLTERTVRRDWDKARLLLSVLLKA